MSAHVIALDQQRQPRKTAAHVINVHAYVSMILDAANSLLRDNLTIVGFQADPLTIAPTVWVIDSPYVRNLARVGVASYDRTGSDAHGPYKVGRFERCGVNIEWIERVPA